MIAMVALAPALPAVVGNAWEGVPSALLWSGVALIAAAPMSAVGAGYLYAVGEPGAVAVATLASSGVWLIVTIPLLGPAGAAAVGIGWIPASIVHAALVWRPTMVLSGVPWLGSAAVVVTVALAGAGGRMAGGQRHRAGCRQRCGRPGRRVERFVVGMVGLARPALRDVAALTRALCTRLAPEP